MKFALILVAMFGGLVLLWFGVVFVKVHFAANTYDAWRTVAQRFGLDVDRSGNFDVPSLNGSIDGRTITVSPVREQKYGRSIDTHYTQTSFEMDLPEAVPEDLAITSSGAQQVFEVDASMQVPEQSAERIFDFRGPAGRTEALQQDPQVEEALMELAKAGDSVQIGDGRVHVEVDSPIHDSRELAAPIEGMIAVAEALDEAFTGETEPGQW